MSRVTWHLFNGNNFATSAALAEVCALRSAVLVMFYNVCILLCLSFEVLGHRRRCSQPVNLPVSDSVYDNRTFAKEFRERFSTLKTEFDEVCSHHIQGAARKTHPMKTAISQLNDLMFY